MGLTSAGSGWEAPRVRFVGTQSQEMLYHPDWRHALQQSTRWARGGNEANGELARPLGAASRRVALKKQSQLPRARSEHRDLAAGGPEQHAARAIDVERAYGRRVRS